jgi:hypothetical protein
MKGKWILFLMLAVLVPCGTRFAENAARDENRNTAILFYDDVNGTTRMPRVNADGKIMTTLSAEVLEVVLSDDIASETTLAQILTALQQLKFSGENLKIYIENSSLPVTQSGTWDINAITTLPAITGSVDVGTVTTLPAITGTVDIGTVTTLPAITGTVTANVEGGNTTDVKVTLDSESIAVTGTFWQETQPVSGSMTISGTDVDIRDLSSATDSISAVQSGTWNITNVSGAISLPTGAATETTLSNINGKITAADTGNVTISTFPDNEPFDLAQYSGSAVGASNAVHVQPGTGAVFAINDNSGSLTVDGSVTVSATNLDIRDFTATTDSVLTYANTAKDGSGTNYVPVVDSDGQLQVDILSMPAIEATLSDNVFYETHLEQFKFTGDDLKVTLDSETVLVNGTVEITNFPATQPVSIASMPSTPVTGTFWQETQPVSGNVTVSGTDIDIRDLTNATDSIAIYGSDGTNRLIKTDSSGAIQVDVESGSINATCTATDFDIRDIDVTSDNILVYFNTAKDGTGTDLVPLLDADGHQQIDVLSMPSTTVTATDLDIRNLTSVSDSVEVKQATASNLKAEVSGTDIDIRDLTSVSDSVSAAQSGTWDIGTVTTITNAVTVSATDLDMRDLSSATDSITIEGGNSSAVKVDGSAVTQPVSGSVTATLAASDGIDIGNVDVASITDSTETETMVHLTMTSADTEYSYTLPAGTVYFFAREITGAREIRYAWASGQTADGGVYQPIYAKEGKESPYRTGSKVGAKTLYFRDKSNAGTVIGIEIWTK